MIFDNGSALQLYDKLLGGDLSVLEKLHSETKPLIETIALSLDPTQFDDLCQEGHLKLHLLMSECRYDPERSLSLYSFLSSALRNHMYDYLRRDENADELCEDDCTTLLCKDMAELQLTDVRQYSVRRFPSYSPALIGSAVDYVIVAAAEVTVDGYKGVIRTLATLYSLKWRAASVVYHSTIAVLRLCALGGDWKSNVDDALRIITCRKVEMSLLPEVILLLGRDKAGVMNDVFCGSYVKF